MALARTFNIQMADQPVQFALRVEAFNALNHTRFVPPNTSMSSSDFGRILYANSPRILQGSLKMTF
jgi:hypothetical protein